MQFSDTTNKNGLIQHCEFLTNVGDTGISGNSTLLKQFTNLINRNYHRAVTIILNSQDEWDFDDGNHTDYPILTADLVASQQDYNLPLSEKVLKFNRLEVTYDGSNWYRVEPLDKNEILTATDTTTIANNFSTNKPFYDTENNSLWLYPIPTTNVTGGLKAWWTREIDEFTSADTTQEPGIDEPFHEYLSIGASHDWAKAKNLKSKDDLKRELLEIEVRMARWYSDKQQDRKLVIRPKTVNYR